MQKSKEANGNEQLPRKRKKQALGRGLGALIPDLNRSGETAGEHFHCDIERIRPNRYQPRTQFKPSELEDLSRSIKRRGVLQPLLVRKSGDAFELIAGERRLRAAKMAGLTSVPVIIRDADHEAALELSIIENIQREDLNPVEEADAYHHLLTRFEMTQEQVAERVGKSRSAVANFLRLRQLPVPVRESLSDGILSMGHARALLGAKSPAVQNAAFRTVVSKAMSVRETENLIKRMNKSDISKGPTKKDSDDIYFESIAEDLSRHFGTKVRIKRKGRKGRLELDFYNNEDLDRILGLLNAS